MNETDQDLRARFEAARRAERRWVPSFERVVAGRPGRRRGVGLTVAAIGLAAVVGLVWFETRPPEQLPIGVSVASLRTSTDFLLNVLGAETLRTVPTIGTGSDWFPSGSSAKGSSL